MSKKNLTPKDIIKHSVISKTLTGSDFIIRKDNLHKIEKHLKNDIDELYQCIQTWVDKINKKCKKKLAQ